MIATPTESPRAGEVLLTRKQVLERIGMGRTWLRDAVAGGRFPQPVRIGNRVLFILSELDAWIAERAAERTPSAPPTRSAGPEGPAL